MIDQHASASAHFRLREATAADHFQVDAAFARFDLGSAASYASFLQAHARALTPVEAALAGAQDLPPWRPREALLAADLAALGRSFPQALAFDPGQGDGALHGALYVLEGSRLGGALLFRRLGTGLPGAYLSATHARGEWRTLMGEIDRRAAASPSVWLDQAIDGARRAFDLFARAATVQATLADPR